MTWRRIALVGSLFCVGCQDAAPVQVGAASVHASGHITVDSMRREIAIRLDRQACVQPIGVNFRDASGLGVLVIQTPFSGWAVGTYTLPRVRFSTRGYLNVSGIGSSFPLVRGTTTITRADSVAVDGHIDWTVGHPVVTGAMDTVRSRVRVVGRFHALRQSCD
ncbi:MAG: hypothetical protein IT355_14320 [Gemmatimonadaceae bacterium]|nr:hypothetical protein [Gemmatimonadaceae bacterium]